MTPVNALVVECMLTYVTADRRPTPGLAMNFSSNNPFRRAASPQNLSPTSPSITGVAAGNSSPHIQPPPPPPPPPPPANSRRSPRPVSTNPFLDTYQTQNMPPPAAPARRSGSPTKQAGSSVQNYQDSKLGKDGPTVGVTELLVGPFYIQNSSYLQW